MCGSSNIQRSLSNQKAASYLLSQMTAFRSRWLVGSSSIRRVGSMNRALWGKNVRVSEHVGPTPDTQVLGCVPGQGDSHPPTSGEPLSGSVLHLRGERQTSQDPSCFGLSCCGSYCSQLFVDLLEEEEEKQSREVRRRQMIQKIVHKPGVHLDYINHM